MGCSGGMVVTNKPFNLKTQVQVPQQQGQKSFTLREPHVVNMIGWQDGLNLVYICDVMGANPREKKTRRNTYLIQRIFNIYINQQ